MTLNGTRHDRALEKATVIPELHGIGRDFARELAFEYFLYAVQIPKPPGPAIHFVVSAYPAAWRRLYDCRQYVRIDPVVLHAFKSAIPIAWDEVPRKDDSVRSFFEEASSHGLANGISAPVYGRRGEMGLFSLARKADLPDDPEVRLAVKKELQWFATAYNEKALKIVSYDQVLLQRRAGLTPRERQCLTLVAEGKRSSEIAAHMKITERTVLFHIDTAGQKLGVSGRHNIIARAVSDGEIDLNWNALAPGRPLPRDSIV